MLLDIISEIRAIKSDNKAIRNFGITFLFVLSAIGGLLLFKGRNVGYVWIGLGGLFFLLGLWVPLALRGVYQVWMGLAVVLGYFMSRIILSLVFYLVVTPIGLLLKISGKDILNQKWDTKADSYWRKRDTKPADKKQYEKLY
jgi:hypothetical protein